MSAHIDFRAGRKALIERQARNTPCTDLRIIKAFIPLSSLRMAPWPGRSSSAVLCITRFDNLEVTHFVEEDTKALGELANRAMKIQVNIQDDDVMVSVDDTMIYVTPARWKNAKG